jgi:predicted dehydrogenase
MRVAVIGARKARQGTGEYIARDLHRSGCEVVAVLGTRPETSTEAAQGLRPLGIEARAYTSLERLLDDQRPDAVAVCSPAELHEDHLSLVLAAGCHALCEKPLVWSEAWGPAEARTTAEALVERWRAAGRVLWVNTQWPYTLQTFRRLFPDQEPGPARTFAMRLGPTSRGAAMVVDSGSHLLSMLHALAGPGELEGLAVQATGRDLTLSCRYVHAAGQLDASLELLHSPQPPRPAGYTIDGLRVRREVELPDYRLRFEADDGRQEPLPDPLTASVAAFVRTVRGGSAIDYWAGHADPLARGVYQLQQLVAAARDTSVPEDPCPA